MRNRRENKRNKREEDNEMRKGTRSEEKRQLGETRNWR